MTTPSSWSTRRMGHALGRFVGVAALVTLALATAGCGTPRVQPQASATPSASGSIDPSPSADDFISAIISTQSMGTAKLVVDLSTSVDGSDRSLHGTGISALDAGYADMAWTIEAAASDRAGTTREMVNDQGIFVQVDPPDGGWTHISTSGPTPGDTPTSASADPLRRLEVLRDVTVEGPEAADGIPATRLVGWLPVDEGELTAMGLSDEEIVAIGTIPDGARVDVTVWLDASDHVIRVDRLLDLGGTAEASAFSSTRLVAFSEMIDLLSPTSGVAEAPSQTP